jgi:hypothetical protein
MVEKTVNTFGFSERMVGKKGVGRLFVRNVGRSVVVVISQKTND